MHVLWSSWKSKVYQDWWHYTHTKKLWKVYYLNNEGCSESKADLSNHSKMVWKSKKRRVAWVLIVIRGWSQCQHFYVKIGANVVRIFHSTKGENFQVGAFINLSRCKEQGKRVMFKSHQQSHINMGSESSLQCVHVCFEYSQLLLSVYM